MELKVVVAEGSLAEHRLVQETIMEEVQAALTRMGVKATLSLVEEDPAPSDYGDIAVDAESEGERAVKFLEQNAARLGVTVERDGDTVHLKRVQ
jgi:hypothetical protein